jgi:hypothetical protein
MNVASLGLLKYLIVLYVLNFILNAYVMEVNDPGIVMEQ